MGALYRIDFPNGRAYIGITVKTAEDRFAEHFKTSARGSPHAVHRALRKYGAAAEVETLVIASDWPYLCALEQRAITVYGTLGEGGYNMTLGGEGVMQRRKHTPGARARMSAAKAGRKQSLAACAIKSRAMQGNKRSAGKHASESTKAKMARSQVVRAVANPRSSSGVTGVSWCPSTGRWRAMMRGTTIGRFDTVQAAALARSQAEKEAYHV